jgi:hypothetical protein
MIEPIKKKRRKGSIEVRFILFCLFIAFFVYVLFSFNVCNNSKELKSQVVSVYSFII